MKILLKVFDNPREYLTSVLAFLEVNEAENSLLLGNLLRDLSKSQLITPFMAEVKYADKTVFAAYFMERNLIISAGSKESIALVCEKLKDLNIKIPGVVGPADQAKWLSTEWCKINNCTSHLAVDQLVYELTEVIWPTGVLGRMRPANLTDVPVLANWIYEFHTEALMHEPFTKEQAQKNAESRIPANMTFIWEVEGRPVSMAALSRPTSHGITVNAVYTPQELRKKGCASALVAALSAEGLKRGKDFCTLFTDVNNPTSNAIYQKIGYRPISKFKKYRFQYSK